MVEHTKVNLFEAAEFNLTWGEFVERQASPFLMEIAKSDNYITAAARWDPKRMTLAYERASPATFAFNLFQNN